MQTVHLCKFILKHLGQQMFKNVCLLKSLDYSWKSNKTYRYQCSLSAVKVCQEVNLAKKPKQNTQRSHMTSAWHEMKYLRCWASQACKHLSGGSSGYVINISCCVPIMWFHCVLNIVLKTFHNINWLWTEKSRLWIFFFVKQIWLLIYNKCRIKRNGLQIAVINTTSQKFGYVF